jgi:Fur family peroxide stress response transcriptional regulator
MATSRRKPLPQHKRSTRAERNLPPLDEAELKARFAASGLPLTIQRRAILDELRLRDDHPTADLMYEAVSARLAGLSRATVYRTLETLVELGLAARICHPGSSARYDGKTWRHHHLICDGCGTVLDVELPRLELPAPRTHGSGFVVRDFSVQFSGLCYDCAGWSTS